MERMAESAPLPIGGVCTTERQADLLADFSSYNPNPILVVDLDGTVLYRNPAADNLLLDLGLAATDIATLLPAGLADLLHRSLRQGEDLRRLEVQAHGRWFGWSLYPVTHRGIAYLHGTELTDFKRAEEEQSHLRMRLIQSDKMASIGQLSAGIAHEINNPLSFVTVNLNYIQESATALMTLAEEYGRLESAVTAGDADNEVSECLARIQAVKDKVNLPDMLEELPGMIVETKEGTERVRVIVQNLKEFSHVGQGACKHAHINQCLQATLKIVSYELKYKAKVVEDYGQIPDILCYPQELNQVFMNLLVNASHALPKRGEIRIKTFQKDNHVVAEISDTGCGIPPEHLKKIFEPFFTTKEVGKGTGLGLSISHDIVKKHKGRLEVESTVGVGTTFRVWLPIDSKPAGPEGSA
jgi:signal transduction histidine kinase